MDLESRMGGAKSKPAATEKKKGAGKPGAAGAKGTMEEITDNRPRIVSYVNDF
jgi:hypothetical protein